VRKLVALVAGVAVVVPSSAAAANRRVTMVPNVFQPSRVVALVGDTVTWTNNDFSNLHNVNAPTFASPDLARGQSFTSPPFGAPGTIAYHCTRHVGMRGMIAVYSLYLSGPATPVAFGRSAVLTGLAPEGSGVSIRRLADGATVATTTASAEGTFSVTIPSPAPGAYQAVAAGRTSAAVPIAVRPRVRLETRRAPRGVVLATVSTRPGQAGATVAIERAWRGGWRRLATKRLGSQSRVSFRLRPSGSMRIRARLVRPVDGYAVATSASVVVRR